MSGLNLRSRELGRYLRALRRSRNLSLGNVAKTASRMPNPVTKSHLSRIENGHAEPSFRKLYSLCKIYDVSLSSLVERYEIDLRREEAATTSRAKPPFPSSREVEFAKMRSTEGAGL